MKRKQEKRKKNCKIDQHCIKRILNQNCLCRILLDDPIIPAHKIE